MKRISSKAIKLSKDRPGTRARARARPLPGLFSGTGPVLSTGPVTQQARARHEHGHGFGAKHGHGPGHGNFCHLSRALPNYDHTMCVGLPASTTSVVQSVLDFDNNIKDDEI